MLIEWRHLAHVCLCTELPLQHPNDLPDPVNGCKGKNTSGPPPCLFPDPRIVLPGCFLAFMALWPLPSETHQRWQLVTHCYLYSSLLGKQRSLVRQDEP